MTRLATAVFATLFTIAVVTGVAIALVRSVRRLQERRRARQAAAPRRLLLALAAGGGEQELAQLAQLPAGQWQAVAPTAFALLAKVRGEARAALAEVFARRGLIVRARRDLRRRGAVRRARAASALGSVGDRSAAPELCRLLTDPHPDVRVAAVQALGRVGDPTTTGPLLASLDPPQPTPSQLVAHALVQLGPSAIPELVEALDADSPLVRVTVLDGLRLLAAAEAEEPVATVLRDDPALEVRLRAAATLGRVGSRPAMGALLAAADPSEPAALRAAAARALGELGAASAVSPLQALLHSPDYRTGSEAAAALLRLGTTGHRALVQAAAGADRAGAHAREALALAELAQQRANRVPRRRSGAGQGR